MKSYILSVNANVNIRLRLLSLLLIVRIITGDDTTSNVDDGCDKYKWRRCTTNDECSDFKRWKGLSWTAPNDPREPAAWEDYVHGHFTQYTCMVPNITTTILDSSSSSTSSSLSSSCTIKRCIPTIESGYSCTTGSDCYDGQTCSMDGYCTHCNQNTNYAHHACHQPKTNGIHGSPPFNEGQSGCAGDHCLHVCPYDTKCIRILNNTTALDVTAPHNALVGILHLTNDTREELIRPSTCDGQDEGLEGSGMRCAGFIHRTVTSRERTPDALRKREDVVVELKVSGGYRTNWWDRVQVAPYDLEQGGVEVGKILYLGHVVDPSNPDLQLEEGIITGGGAFAYSLSNFHWGYEGIITCDVRRKEDVPIHTTWKNIQPTTEESTLTKTTLQTRICIRWKGHGDVSLISFIDQRNNQTLYFGNSEQRWCASWGSHSDFQTLIPFPASCSLFGPDNIVSHPSSIPTNSQRKRLYLDLHAGFENGSLSGSDVLRTAFHDGATYSRPDYDTDRIESGTQGCMRFEHVHGQTGNAGIQFSIDSVGIAIGCGGMNNGYWGEKDRSKCPWSVADILQFAGAVAVAETGGPMELMDQLKWGRLDAPYLFCTGELQLSQADANGGHKAGFHAVGASGHNYGGLTARLAITFEATRSYFEDQVGLEAAEWTAFLGAHSIGGVRGLKHASRNFKHVFDETPNILDVNYYKRLMLAHSSNFLSLCPQMKTMQDSHWFSPGPDWEGSFDDHFMVLLDTDVSMTLNSTTLQYVQTYATNQTAWFNAFGHAYIKFGELGWDALVTVPSMIQTTSPSSQPSSQTPCLERPGGEFFWKIGRKEDRVKIKTCNWLQTHLPQKQRKICHSFTSYYTNDMNKTFQPAQVVCPNMCQNFCNVCFENPNSQYSHRQKSGGINVFKTCAKLALKSIKQINRICSRTDSYEGYPPASNTCPQTCRVHNC